MDNSSPECQEKWNGQETACDEHTEARQLIEYETRTFVIGVTGVPCRDVPAVPGILVDDVIYPLSIVKGR